MTLLPTPSKTHQWDHTTVAAQGSLLADLRRGMRTAIIDKLLAKAVGAPTCKGSSNGSAAGMDNVNRWAADADLVWALAGVGHSWIVLQFGSTKFHLCIDLCHGTSSNIAVYLSPTAFTGGSTTARPTSVDEIQVLGVAGAAAQWDRGQTNIQRVYHVDLTTDASLVRIIAFDQNVQCSFWELAIPDNVVTGWTNPMYGGIAPGSGSTIDGICTYAQLFQSGGLFKAKGVSAMTLDFTTESRSTQKIGELQTVPNSLSGGYPLTPCGLYSATASNIGRHGSVVDLWAGSTTNSTGDTYPSGATRTFMTFGDLVVPWDGTVLATA